MVVPYQENACASSEGNVPSGRPFEEEPELLRAFRDVLSSLLLEAQLKPNRFKGRRVMYGPLSPREPSTRKLYSQSKPVRFIVPEVQGVGFESGICCSASYATTGEIEFNLLLVTVALPSQNGDA